MSLIFYNPHAMKKLSSNYNDSMLFDIRRNVCGISRVDEWNKEFFGTEIKNLYPMFDYNTLNYGLSFEGCLEKRAKEIVAQGKKIHLYWSGGMDSCVALLSLITFNDIKDLDLEVFTTTRAIKDFTEYFEQIIKPNFKYTIEDEYDDLLNNAYRKDVLNVSGDGAEEVVGWSGEMSYACECIGPTFHHTKISELHEKDRHNRRWAGLYKEVESTLQYSPIPIETIYDLNYWVRLNFDYQYASMRFAVPYVDDLTDYETYNVPFFLTDYFFDWSLRNYVPLQNLEDYNHYDKMPWKVFLAKFFDVSLYDRIINMQRFTNVEYYNYVATTYFGYDDNYKTVPLLDGLKLTPQEIARFEGYDKQEMLLLYD